MKRRRKSFEKKNRETILAPRHTTWHGCQAAQPDRAWAHGRATQYGQAVPLFWLAGRAGLLVHGRTP